MKTKRIGILFSILLCMVGTRAFAYDIAVENADGITIYYNYINDGKELEVTYNEDNKDAYKGNLVIPEDVTFMSRTRKVISIGDNAFIGCDEMTFVSIPNSVTHINDKAFAGCRGLTSITIPNSVIFIGNYAFKNCWGLTSVTIPNSVTFIGDYAFQECLSLTSVIIGDNVTSIGNNIFSGCRRLTSVTIPNSVTFIGDYAFLDCDSLTSVAIPNSVTSIGTNAFEGCNSLSFVKISDIAAWCNVKFKSLLSNPLVYAQHLYLNDEELKDLIIPDNVTTISEQAFVGCKYLTSVTIGNSVTSIGKYAFNSCRGLKLVIIGNSVTNIGACAFFDADIPIIVSHIENPFVIKGKYYDMKTFSQNTFNNATLYVPVGTIDKYRETEGWKDFVFIEEGAGPPGGETPETKKCAKPTISYKNGRLTFNCDTEGAVCQYSITDDDIKTGSSNEVQLGVTYHISVYATKAGYDNSETATATLCWIDIEPKSEGLSEGMTQVSARAVMVKAEGGQLTVEGAEDNTNISVYAIDGIQVGTTTSRNGIASIMTAIPKDSVAIVKIGNKSVKVMMK